MKPDSVRTAMSLAGVAALAACACGTSAGIGRLSSSFGVAASTRSVHPFFLAAGAVLIIGGLWDRNRRAAMLSVIAMLFLGLGELLTPPMSLGAADLDPVQITGLIASLIAAVFLVAAFFKAYPSPRPGPALTAMSGAVLAVGCNCCLVTMGITGLAHHWFPSQPWLARTLPVYIAAAVLMGAGLFKLGSPLGAATAMPGQAFLYYWLELPYKSLPAITIHDTNVNFVIKYPMMFGGALLVMAGFVVAYRRQEQRAFPNAGVMEPSFGD